MYRYLSSLNAQYRRLLFSAKGLKLAEILTDILRTRSSP